MSELTVGTACAHSRVKLYPHRHEDGTYSDKWFCMDCDTEFVSRAFYDDLKAEVERLNKVLGNERTDHEIEIENHARTVLIQRDELTRLRAELERVRRESVRAESLVDWFDRRMNVRIQKLGNPDYTFLKVAEEMYDLLCGIWHRYETPARAQRKEGGQ